jgi:hypothetical protein
MDLDEIQSRAGAGHPDSSDRAIVAPPYCQDSSIITQVGVAPLPSEAIASDHRTMAGCAQCEPDVAILLSSKEAQIGNQRIAFDFSGERSVVDTHKKQLTSYIKIKRG